MLNTISSNNNNNNNILIRKKKRNINQFLWIVIQQKNYHIYI